MQIILVLFAIMVVGHKSLEVSTEFNFTMKLPQKTHNRLSNTQLSFDSPKMCIWGWGGGGGAFILVLGGDRLLIEYIYWEQREVF